MSLKITDKGLIGLVKRLHQANSLRLTVGVHGEEGGTRHSDSSLTIVDIATVHEYGTKHIEARSFIRAWADEKKAEHIQTLRKIGLAVVLGQFTAEIGLKRAGVLFVGQIQKRISDGIPPALKEATKARKGSSVPLIDTNQLRSSIRSKTENETK